MLYLQNGCDDLDGGDIRMLDDNWTGYEFLDACEKSLFMVG